MDLVLTAGEWQLVYNAFSFVFATMAAAALFFILTRRRVAPRYRMAVILSTIVVAVAAYHYLRIFDSWSAGFALTSAGDYAALGTFNEGYRYVDWLLTVPLLVAELVLLLGLEKGVQRSMIARLGTAAALMVVLGYPGEVSSDSAVKWGFWVAAMVPFLYILYILYTEFGRALQRQSAGVARRLSAMRTLLVVSWFFYPIAYLLPLTGLDAAAAEVLRQVGYSVSDVVAKVIFGLLLYAVARTKSEEAGYEVESGKAPAAA